MKRENKLTKKIVKVLSIITFSLLLVSGSACTLSNMIDEVFGSKDIISDLDIELDEKEIASINVSEQDMEKKYDISKDISSIADEVDNPFKPFYIEEDQQEEKNILGLDNIYTKDGEEYAEISFNDFQYLLKEGDIFAVIYLVQSINESSVVLLKGDEIITIFIDVLVYD